MTGTGTYHLFSEKFNPALSASRLPAPVNCSPTSASRSLTPVNYSLTPASRSLTPASRSLTSVNYSLTLASRSQTSINDSSTSTRGLNINKSVLISKMQKP